MSLDLSNMSQDEQRRFIDAFFVAKQHNSEVTQEAFLAIWPFIREGANRAQEFQATRTPRPPFYGNRQQRRALSRKIKQAKKA